MEESDAAETADTSVENLSSENPDTSAENADTSTEQLLDPKRVSLLVSLASAAVPLRARVIDIDAES